MPPLIRDDQIASTFEEKTEMLKLKFFPPAPTADLSDIEGSFYPSPHCPTIVTKSKVTELIRRLKPDTAPGPDGITNRIVKLCSEKMSDLLTPLFQACIDQAYHPRAFETANIIIPRKIVKDDYTAPNTYRSIVLLNTLGKVMESIISKKITHLAETYRLLPDTQMGARRGRLTETALELLTEQIHTVWGQGNDKVATLLSMDVAGAYDKVLHRRLIYNLRKRKILKWITDLVDSFLNERSTTLAIHSCQIIG